MVQSEAYKMNRVPGWCTPGSGTAQDTYGTAEYFFQYPVLVYTQVHLMDHK